MSSSRRDTGRLSVGGDGEVNGAYRVSEQVKVTEKEVGPLLSMGHNRAF